MVQARGRLGFWPKGTAAAKGAGEKVEKWGRGGRGGGCVRARWVRGWGARATVGSTSIQRCLMHDPREMAMAQSERSTRV